MQTESGVGPCVGEVCVCGGGGGGRERHPNLLYCDTVYSTIANHLEVKRYYFKHDPGNVILFDTKNI